MQVARVVVALTLLVTCGCGGAAQSGSDTPAVPAANEASLDIVTNSIGMQLVRIPAGKFMMGTVGADPTKSDEAPAHQVKLKSYYLGRTEVTKGQFAKFVAATNYKTEAEKSGSGGTGIAQPYGKESGLSWRSWGFADGDYHPVVNVSWNDAVAFCEWLSKTEGKQYSLPSEAEWEYACRAGTMTKYFNGDDKDAVAKVGIVIDKTFAAGPPALVKYSSPSKLDDGYLYTAPVARFAPNKFGVYDMHGNVEEWCLDSWYDYEAKPATDPVHREPSNERVYRGGSWYCDLANVASAYRGKQEPDDSFCYTGFRVRLEAPQK